MLYILFNSLEIFRTSYAHLLGDLELVHGLTDRRADLVLYV